MAGPADLQKKADEFASELTDTFAGVLGPSTPCFLAMISPKRRGVVRFTIDTEDSVEIPLMINGVHTLSMVVYYQGTWDTREKYIKILRADVDVLPARKTAPLWRYEFEADKGERFPCAHLQVHAHRDEFIHAMVQADKGKAGQRRQAALGNAKAGAPPQFSDVHFPLGGPRMRPCVEDVLNMLISEFEIDHEPDAQNVIDEGRARWRRLQAATIVRDSPAEAVRVLKEELGYKITPPDTGHASERTDRLKRF